MADKKIIVFIITGIICFSLYFRCQAEAVETAPKITDREIIESLVAIRGDIKRIEEKFDQKFEAVDKRFNSMDSRFNSIDSRFNSIDSRFNSVDSRFSELKDFMLWGFGVMFAGMFSLVGFVLWDRRSALSPAIRKNKELEEREERIERVLKDVAAKDSNMAEALRRVGLL